MASSDDEALVRVLHAAAASDSSGEGHKEDSDDNVEGRDESNAEADEVDNELGELVEERPEDRGRAEDGGSPEETGEEPEDGSEDFDSGPESEPSADPEGGENNAPYMPDLPLEDNEDEGQNHPDQPGPQPGLQPQPQPLPPLELKRPYEAHFLSVSPYLNFEHPGLGLQHNPPPGFPENAEIVGFVKRLFEAFQDMRQIVDRMDPNSTRESAAVTALNNGVYSAIWMEAKAFGLIVSLIMPIYLCLLMCTASMYQHSSTSGQRRT
jgi:hypothetical protein